MSDSGLPDDLSQWPRDPHELLGVTSNVDPRDLRRAYTRLIRTYKPEQYPEHLRRIRTECREGQTHAPLCKTGDAL
jgi:preprotein translocase subunit Sec63